MYISTYNQKLKKIHQLNICIFKYFIPAAKEIVLTLNL